MCFYGRTRYANACLVGTVGNSGNRLLKRYVSNNGSTSETLTVLPNSL